MKVKVTLLLYSSTSNFINNLLPKDLKIKKSITKQNNKPLIFTYEYNDSNSTIFYLKLFVSLQFNIKLDHICFLKHNQPQNIFQIVKDTEDINNCIQFNSSNQSFLDLHYKLISIPIKLKIDCFHNQIDSINITLSSNASIYFLKYLLNQKLNNNFPINLQKIFALRLISSFDNSTIDNNENANDLNVRKEYHNDSTLNDIIFSFLKGPNAFINETLAQYKLHLLLVTETENHKLNFGLNFKFNFFKNMNKITYQQNAPSYRECTDGLNIFCYCKNEQCQIYNELFVVNLGYGSFDLINKIINTMQCPKCLCSFLKVQVRNIGFINAKWTYRGKINNRQQSVFNGEGSTLDEKLYVLKEINFEICFKSFELNVTLNDKKLTQEEMNHSLLSSNNLDNFDLVLKEDKKDIKKDLKSFLSFKNGTFGDNIKCDSSDNVGSYSKKTSFCYKHNDKLNSKEINVNIEHDDGKCCSGGCMTKYSGDSRALKNDNNLNCLLF